MTITISAEAVAWYGAIVGMIPATVDILHLRLRWPECGGVPVRLSQSAVVIREGFIAGGWASETDYDTHAVAGGTRYGRVRVRRG